MTMRDVNDIIENKVAFMNDETSQTHDVKNEYYQDVIAPGVKGLAANCRRESITAFFAFENKKGQFDYTIVGDINDSEKLRIFSLINDCWTVDELVKKIIMDARKNGHNSRFLSAIGIPKEPINV